MEFGPDTLNALLVRLANLGVPFALNYLKSKRNTGEKDQKAAWDLYVEMATRITTQPLDPEHGDEKTALDSVYSLFQTTRDILHEHGPDCVEFAQIAIVILNEKVRPFTADWRRRSLAGDFDDPAACAKFREELESLQKILRAYMDVLAEIAGIEDISGSSDSAEA